jgi:predicted acetyltransferase
MNRLSARSECKRVTCIGIGGTDDSSQNHASEDRHRDRTVTTAESDVTVEQATRADEARLSNLLEFYLHDLSDVFGLTLGPDGRFGYPWLPRFWSEPEKRFAYLICCRGDLAGFALVTRGSPASDDPDALDVAEFFVLRPYRRSGVGRRAAFLLWDRMPGRWVVRVSQANQAALPFWEDVVGEYTRGQYSVKPFAGKSHAFRVFLFTSRNAAD